MGEVESAVREVFGPLKPTEDVSLEKMSSLILDVRRRIEGTSAEARRYVYGPTKRRPVAKND